MRSNFVLTKYLAAIAIIVFVGCADNAPQAPKIESISSVSIGDTVYFTGKAIIPQKTAIIQMGFVYGTNQAPTLLKDKTLPYTGIESAFFRLPMLNIADNEVRYARAFLQTQHDLIYGEPLTFYGLYHEPVIINSFLPLEGKAGEYVKIYGSAFGSDKNNIKVFFGDLQAEIESMSSDRLLVKIPAYSRPQSSAIFVERNGAKFQAIGNFKLVGPEILKLTPNTGIGDVTLIIDGRNFSAVPWHNVVKIGPYATQIVNASPNQLTVKLDTRKFIPGPYKLTVSVDEIAAETDKYFTVETPWKTVKAKPGGGLCQAAQFEIEGKIYICTGIPVSWNTNIYSTQVWQYDIVSDTWTRKKDFPGAGRVDATAFALNGKGYLASGYSTQPESDFWEYDPAADSWTQKASIPNGGKNFASSFAFDGKGYLIMMGAFQMQNEFWQYAPLTNQWTRLDDFPGSSRVYGKLFVFNNALYVAGGYYSTLPFKPDIWKYNFATQNWQLIGEINFSPEAVYVFNDKVFVLSNDRDYFGNFELRHFEYDPDANTKGNDQYYFAGAYRNHLGVSVVYGNSVYIGLGTEFGSNDCLSDTWKLELK
jgi:N-acetylneuraminic acid mutarotase